MVVEIKTGRIEIKDVMKQYSSPSGEKLTVLDHLNLTVEPGEFISVIGPSGCGKTTLLRIISGLAKATGGEIFLDGEKVTDTSHERGFMFQYPELFKWMNVENNVAFGLKARSMYKERKKDVQKYIELVGLKGFEKSYPHHLSGGMAQRVALARALINHPKVLLLDEPFGSLDAFTRATMQQELTKIWSEIKMTMIMVTHDVDEAVFLSSKILVMSPRPAKVEEILVNDLPRPREKLKQPFIKLRNKILDYNAPPELGREIFSDIQVNI